MTRLQANTLLLITAAIWGSTFVAQQVAMDELGPMAFTAARFFLGSLVVTPLAVREWRGRRRQQTPLPFSRLDWGGALLIGLFLFAGTILQQIGIIYTTITNTGFLTALYVPLVPILGLLLFRRMPPWTLWPAVLSCLAGTYLLSGVDSSFTLGLGDSWVISSSLFWALHVLFIGVFSARTGMPITLAAIQFAVCTVISTLFAMAMETTTLSALLASSWSIAYAGLFSVGLAYTLQVIGQGHTQPAVAALIFSLESVFAAICGALFLGEHMNSQQLLGCALIFSAVIMVEVIPYLWRMRRSSVRK